ncbi:ankyrin repeat family protein [Orientia chuto str. Dubai]|uniref:Ankyrin repeat family protein n=1 Tax=Orientia chuto str. Dubai TaxID=1359168 RepID=A0A0F3MP74_9RICK|nr:ankyrin repeat domain-containing protein [Candidatus Orientia mediorientalis]KJV57252.1 ankyrin repeat family protein [Orientia chuto str. Dubai]
MGNTVLHEASKVGDIEKLIQLLSEQSNIDINAQDELGNAALHYAAQEGHIEVIKLLLSHGADINLQVQGQYTNAALHFAVKKGHTEVVELLLNCGADINLQGNVKQTPLMMAVRAGYIDVIKHLYIYKADLGIPDAFGIPPLNAAVQKNNVEVVKVLLSYITDPMLLDSALHTAVQRSNTILADILLANGANVNSQDFFGNTPLSRAITNQAKECVKLLLSYKADINLQNNNGETPLVCNRFNIGINHAAMDTLLIAHIVKLEYCGVGVNTAGFRQNKALISQSPLLTELEQKCQQEVQKMNSMKIGKSTFFDIFVLTKDMNILARCANSSDIVQCSKVNFPIYDPFINESIEKGKQRNAALNNAVTSMNKILAPQSDEMLLSETSWSSLPNEIQYMILEHLSDEELIKIQSPGEEDSNVQVTGAHAIYDD